MGTGNRLNSTTIPHMSLPRRRYSVPETVMRKYTLSRAQTSESGDSCIATVPTPSVPSGSLRSGRLHEEFFYHDYRGVIKKMHHKSCQTGDSDLQLPSQTPEFVDTIMPLAVITRTIRNILTEGDERRDSYNEESQSYHEEYHKEITNQDITLPGSAAENLISPTDRTQEEPVHKVMTCSDTSSKLSEVSKIANSDIIGLLEDKNVQCLLQNITHTKTVNLLIRMKAKSLSDCDSIVKEHGRKIRSAEQKRCLNRNSSIHSKSRNHVSTTKKIDDESKYLSEDIINYTNHASTKTQSGEHGIIQETGDIEIIEKEINELTTIEENILNEVVLEKINKETCDYRSETNSSHESETSESKRQEYVEDTPTPIPPSSTATESNSYPRSSESMDCYVTDCDLCNIEGRKCCCFDDTIDSQFCSFTSPDMLTSNELKTSSDITSTSVTLDQTVTDRSTSTQDSTLSITSVTPDSSNKTNDLNVHSLTQNLVISTETVLVKAVDANDMDKNNYTFQLSDSPSEGFSTTGINDTEIVLDRRKNWNSDNTKCNSGNTEQFEMALVISSECALIEPVLFKRTFDLFETNSDVCSSPENNISHKDYTTNYHLNDNMSLQTPSCIDNISSEKNKNFEVQEGNDKEQLGETLKVLDAVYDNNVFILKETGSNIGSNEINIKEKQSINLITSTSYPISKSNVEKSFQIAPKDMTHYEIGSSQTEFINNNIKEDFEPDSLMFYESGNSEDATVIENKLGQLKTKNEDTNKGYYTCDLDETEDDEPFIEESALLEQLGLQGNEKQEKLSTFSQLCGNENKKINYDKMCKKQVQDIFYGNNTYELIVKDIPSNNRTFKANVMPTVANSKKSTDLHKNIDIDTDLVQNNPMERVTEFTLTENDSIQLCKEKNCLNDNGNQCEGTTMGTVSTGTYWETPGTELIIPRYSALPRTLSMLVNTSSIDYSSDSDLSLPDSLEDVHISKTSITWPSSKHDNRLVRGDVMSLLPEKQSIQKKVSSKESQAYFVSLSGEEQEIKPEMIPEQIKQKLLKRDNELKKHTEHHAHAKARHTSKKDHKKQKKFHANIIKSSPSKGCETKSTKFQNVDKRTTSTQWEDVSSSREDSSDTLIAADEEKYVDDIKLHTEDNEDKKVKEDLDSIQNTPDHVSQEVLVSAAENEKHDGTEVLNGASIGTENFNKVVKKLKLNKGIQCSKLTYDTDFDKQISEILISANAYDESLLEKELDEKIKSILLEGLEKFNLEGNNVLENMECSLYKDVGTSVCEEESKLEENEEKHSNLVESKSVQTAFSGSEETDENLPLSKQIQTEEMFLSESDVKFSKQTTFSQLYFEKNKYCSGKENEMHLIEIQNMNSEKGKLESSEQKTTGSDQTSRARTWDNEISVDSNKTLNEVQNSSSVSNKNKFNFSSKQSTKFNVKTVTGRKSGNISKRFRQRFEVIPEEKSGSMDSSADEKRKSPVLQRSRRLSIPLDILPDRLITSNKNNSESSSGNERQEDRCEHSCDTKHDHVTLETNESQRRHTIHGIEGKGIRTEIINKSVGKSEQPRRHTIHGNLSLSSKQNEIIKKLNLMGGTVLKGRVYSKRTGLMFGKFRPLNEETQVEKDEKTLVGEQIEKMRKSGCKGRQALAIAQAGEQEKLLTLSKGWINFYLLRDSQECGSPETSNGEEGHLNSSLSEDKLRHVAPSIKNVTVVGMPENKVRQYTVQIQASPETTQQNETSKLPELNSQILLSPRSPPPSPDLVLPHISPMSSPNSQSSIFSETSNNLGIELPKLLADKLKVDNKHMKRKISSKSEYRVKIPSSPVDSDSNLGCVHLQGSKPDLHSHKTFLSHSTEIVHSGASSPSTSSTCDSASESPTLPSIKWPTRQLQKRSHSKKQRSETSKHVPPLNNNNAGQASWTVTVASNSGCPTQPPPDVEMRLSFSNTMRPTPPSHSDSGLGEDNNMDKKNKRYQALPSSAQKWSLTVKNQQGRESEKSSDLRRAEKQLKCLQDTPSRMCSTSKPSKQRRSSSIESEERQQFSFYWPKVQEIVDDDINRASVFDGELSVTGLAITPERKPRVPTMSERDLTRQLIAHHRHHRSTLIKHSF